MRASPSWIQDHQNLMHRNGGGEVGKRFLKKVAIFQKSLLTNYKIYDTICIQGKGNQAKVKKKDLKKSKKFLTNSTKCGIIKTPRGQEPLVIEKMGGDRHQVPRGQKGKNYDYQ